MEGRYSELSPAAPSPWTRAARVTLVVCATMTASALLLMRRASAPALRAGSSVVPMSTALEVIDGPGGPGAPRGKRVVVGMDTNVNFHIAWNDWDAWSKEMRPFWTEDMIYDFNFVGPWGFGASHGLRAWFNDEHMHFNGAIPDCQWMDFIRAATDQTATSASYGLAVWSGPFADVPPPPNHPKVRVHDLDFYLLEGDRIKINWCIVDLVNLFEQVGYQVLPKSPLPISKYRAPQAMDGFPAPLSSMFSTQDAVASEDVWRAALASDYDSPNATAEHWADDITWYGPGGVGQASKKSEYVNYFLKPLHQAFANIERKTDLVVCEGPYCGAHFHLYGTHVGPWLGQAASGKRVPIRCGAHAHIVGGKIVEGWLIIDQALAFNAMGVDLFARAKTVALASV